MIHNMILIRRQPIDCLMSKQPIISCILPVYNEERYVEAAIRSILKQTFTDFELIVIENGSTDNTKEILKRVGKKDNRIQRIYRQQKGLVEALNHGLRLAKGHYISRMDADSVMYPDCFRQQIEYMEQHPEVGLLGVQFYEAPTPRLLKRARGTPGKVNCKYGLLFYTVISHPGTMLRKSVLDTHQLTYDSNYFACEDYKLWTEIAAVSEVDLLPKLLLFSRSRPEGISKLFHSKQLESCKQVMAIQFRRVLGIENFPYGRAGVFDAQWLKEIYDLAFTERIRQSVDKEAWNAMHLAFQALSTHGGLSVLWYYLRRGGLRKICLGERFGFMYLWRSLSAQVKITLS